MLVAGFAISSLKLFLFLAVAVAILERLLPSIDSGPAWSPSSITGNRLFYWILQTTIAISLGLWLTPYMSKYRLLPPWFYGGTGEATLALVGLYLVITDFLFYFVHRFLGHGILWRLHQIHHRDTRVDWMSSAKGHPLESLVVWSYKLPLVVLLGLPPDVFGFAMTADLMIGVLLHSNIRIPLGPVGAFVATPQFHRMHHSERIEFQRVNFSMCLSLWDRAFGTYEATNLRAYEKYGDLSRRPGIWGELAFPFSTRRQAPRK